MEMKTRKVAEVLKSEALKEEFAHNFGGDVKIKSRSHSIIVEHAPINFLQDINIELRKVESSNNIEYNSTLKAKWIKSLHRRALLQKVTHLIVTMILVKSANETLQNGVIIVGK